MRLVPLKFCLGHDFLPSDSNSGATGGHANAAL
jgi:hypothetical protein